MMKNSLYKVKHLKKLAKKIEDKKRKNKEESLFSKLYSSFKS